MSFSFLVSWFLGERRGNWRGVYGWVRDFEVRRGLSEWWMEGFGGEDFWSLR